jgi:hypothetical protein
MLLILCGCHNGVTEEGITENAITLFFGRTGRQHNRKMLQPENTITRKRNNLTDLDITHF